MKEAYVLQEEREVANNREAPKSTKDQSESRVLREFLLSFPVARSQTLIGPMPTRLTHDRNFQRARDQMQIGRGTNSGVL